MKTTQSMTDRTGVQSLHPVPACLRVSLACGMLLWYIFHQKEPEQPNNKQEAVCMNLQERIEALIASSRMAHVIMPYDET
ncbi:MAG: hypothetical protein II145_00670, partial [Selenomonas sp.]|nr:hypothetical protein [Selenomonas sp.]